MNSLLRCMAILPLCALLTGCACSDQKEGAEQNLQDEKAALEAEELKRVGNDRDEHGCIASAGYQWSELLQECIRPFEKGMRLDPVEKGTATLVTYLVFAPDSSKIEVFLPERADRPLLNRQPEGSCWESAPETAISVRKAGTEWTLSIDGTVRYRVRTDTAPDGNHN